MNIQDDKLIRLHDFLKDNPFNRQHAADHLNITTRQLSRLLKKWEEDGIIIYATGSGRGKNSTIEFIVDIEKEYLNQLLKRMEQLSMEELGNIMKLPLSDASKSVIQSVLEDMLYKNSVIKFTDISSHILVDYIYKVPKTYDPLDNSEVATAMIIFNTMERLYQLDKNNEIKPNLVIFDEWEGNNLIIHLQREIRFTNGHLLTAEDVAASLKRLFTHENHQEIFKNVLDIEVLGTYTLKISMTHRMHIIKFLLSDFSASICKQVDDQWIGTGSYFMHKKSDQMMHLKLNPYLRFDIPDIEEVILVSDMKRYRDFNTSVEMKDVIDTNAERLIFYLFNPRSKRLNYERRKSLAKAIMLYYDKRIPQDTKKEIRLFDNLKALLKDYQIIPFSEPIRFLYIPNSTTTETELIDFLNELGLNIEAVPLSFSDYVYNDIYDLDIDMVLMYEIVPTQNMFYHMLHQSKLRDLFVDEPETATLNYIYEYCHNDYWGYAEAAYGRYLSNGFYIVPISRVLRSYLLRNGYKNMTINSYGIVEYGSIIAVK